MLVSVKVNLYENGLVNNNNGNDKCSFGNINNLQEQNLCSDLFVSFWQ